MHLSLAISGWGGEGLTPGTYGGIAWGLLAFVAKFWPGTGVLDTRGKTHGICNISTILKIKESDCGDWVIESLCNEEGNNKNVAKQWIKLQNTITADVGVLSSETECENRNSRVL